MYFTLYPGYLVQQRRRRVGCDPAQHNAGCGLLPLDGLVPRGASVPGTTVGLEFFHFVCKRIELIVLCSIDTHIAARGSNVDNNDGLDASCRELSKAACWFGVQDGHDRLL